MRPLRIAILVIAAVASIHAEARLDETSIKNAISVGNRCGDVPITRLTKPDGDFEVYIEDAFARVALYAASATQMRRAFGPADVTPDAAALDYRVWVQYRPDARSHPSVSRLSLVPRTAGAGIVQPVRERRFQLRPFSDVPAHGIFDAVRWRRSEWTFDRLPAGDFDVVVQTSAGAQRYRVTPKDREGGLKVCTG